MRGAGQRSTVLVTSARPPTKDSRQYQRQSSLGLAVTGGLGCEGSGGMVLAVGKVIAYIAAEDGETRIGSGASVPQWQFKGFKVVQDGEHDFCAEAGVELRWRKGTREEGNGCSKAVEDEIYAVENGRDCGRLWGGRWRWRFRGQGDAKKIFVSPWNG